MFISTSSDRLRLAVVYIDKLDRPIPGVSAKAVRPAYYTLQIPDHVPDSRMPIYGRYAHCSRRRFVLSLPCLSCAAAADYLQWSAHWGHQGRAQYAQAFDQGLPC